MIYLEVPFKEKDLAKSLGARWDNLSRKWYVPTTLADDLTPFERWLDSESPAQTPQSPAETHKEEEKGISLSTLLRGVQSALRRQFPGAIWVIAEVSNLNLNRGHLYLELSETSDGGQLLAQCRAMIWQSQAGRLLERFKAETGSELAVGQKVLLLAEPSFHEQYGFSLVIQDVDPAFTLGELEANLNAIRKQLVSEQLYTLNKRWSLPADFFRIAVIAPPAAAGLGDFRADADALQKAGLCEFTYFYSAFQGDQVESEMLAALDAITSLHDAHPFDALVIIRGGGAKLDLNQLNIYSVAARICNAPLPVLTGIGHERDNTILDEVANLRFDTPSKVVAEIRHRIFQQAQTAKQHWRQIEQASHMHLHQWRHRFEQLDRKIHQNSRACLVQWKDQLEPLKYQLQREGQQKLQTTERRLQYLQQSIEHLVDGKIIRSKYEIEQQQQKLGLDVQRVLKHKREHIIQWIAFILSSGPKTQLNRGFVIVKDQAGTPIKTAVQAKQAGRIELQFADGTLEARIDPETPIINQE
jgi:exodeoxyribonuclease VII large subunit